jgi:SSS family solute:Na+ symporter
MISFIACAAVVVLAAHVTQADRPRQMQAPFGSTPVLDGILSPGEWDDAFSWEGISDFNEQFFPNLPGPPVDHDADIWVKHDDDRLYFAFNITDDVLYYYQTPEWMPSGNADADNLTREGWPWFGDELEILLNPSNTWSSLNQSVFGNGSSWQMVCNLHKSRMGGVGVAGLLEGEPRSSAQAWQTYQYWILNGCDTHAHVDAF